MRARSALALLALTAACGGDEEKAPVKKPPVAPTGCVAGELEQADGTCLAAGVPADACGQGFEGDGALGCQAILPAAPCPEGQTALPGDAACRALVACGEGDFGDIPVDGQTEHVDAAYAGGSSDGSAAKPWTTIADALAAAAPSAIVAIAAGSYGEDVVLAKPARLWGRCPEMVEIVGAGIVAAVRVTADGGEVRGLAVRGAGGGVVITGAADVVVENVWAHDTEWHGFHVEDYVTPTSATIRGSLAEHAGSFGLYVYGATATVEDLEVRDTEPDGSGQFGYGMQVEDKKGKRAKLTVTHARVERASKIGIGNVGSDLEVAATLVRDTRPTAADQLVGRGINAENDPFTNAAATLTVDTTVVELSHDHGIYAAGVTGSIAHTVVRDTQPEAASGEFGRALNILADYDAGVPSSITLAQCLLERSFDAGLAVFGSTVDAELCVVRQTQLQQASQRYGYGALGEDQIGLRATLSLRSSVVEDSQLFGVVAIGGTDLSLVGTLVQRTAASPDALFGDGVSGYDYMGQVATVGIAASSVSRSARAGISAFGASVTLAGTTLDCNLIDLHTETVDGTPAVLEDDGANICGCESAEHACAASTAAVAPPDPLPAN